MSSGTVSLTGITECDAEAAQAVTERSIEIDGSGDDFTGDNVTAMKVTDFAAVGGALGTPLKAMSDQECLHTCATFIRGCSTVTTGSTLIAHPDPGAL